MSNWHPINVSPEKDAIVALLYDDEEWVDGDGKLYDVPRQRLDACRIVIGFSLAGKMFQANTGHDAVEDMGCDATHWCYLPDVKDGI